MRLLGYLLRLGTIIVAVALSLVLATGTVAATGRPLHANLLGANEVPGPGDPDGIGRARIRLNGGQGRICYAIHVENITLPAEAAHIHSGAAGVAGPVVVALAPPDAEGNAMGCVFGVDRQLIRAIRHHPRQFYVNVHTSDYPAGAVRGQLHWHAKPQ